MLYVETFVSNIKKCVWNVEFVSNLKTLVSNLYCMLNLSWLLHGGGVVQNLHGVLYCFLTTHFFFIRLKAARKRKASGYPNKTSVDAPPQLPVSLL